MIKFLKKFNETVEGRIDEAKRKRESASNWLSLAKSDLRSANDDLMMIDAELAENMKSLVRMKNVVNKEITSNDDVLDVVLKAKL